MKKVVLLALVLTLSGLTGFAQKYGHVNFGTLVSMLPETKAADTALLVYQQQLMAKGEEMAKAFQAGYAAFVKDVQSGNLTPVQQQERQEKLQGEQQAILKYEEDMQQMAAKKREELLNPIVEKGQKAIEEIAKANGYVMIFDTSIFNSILFAQETDDIMPLLKAKLGIKDEAPAKD